MRLYNQLVSARLKTFPEPDGLAIAINATNETYSSNQSTNQSINPSIHQSINQSINQQPISQSINKPITHLINQLVNQSIKLTLLLVGKTHLQEEHIPWRALHLVHCTKSETAAE